VPRRRFGRRPLSMPGLGLLFLAAVGVTLAAPRWLDWWVLTDLRDRGATAPARITSLTADPFSRYSTDIVHYEFRASGEDRPREGLERFVYWHLSPRDPSELVRRASKGTLEARYRPDDPTVHRLDVFFPERIRHACRSGLLYLGLAAAVAIWGTVLLRRGGMISAPDPRAIR
jgi:hypothetical protein